MATEFSFDLSTSGLKSPKELDRKINRAAYATVKYWDGRAEAHMKHNAPWTDRTTNARNGLKAEAAKLGKNVFAIILSHAVTYGIYLELGHSHSVVTKNDGVSEWDVEPRPIIVPTIELFAPKVMATLKKIMDRL